MRIRPCRAGVDDANGLGADHSRRQYRGGLPVVRPLHDQVRGDPGDGEQQGEAGPHDPGCPGPARPSTSAALTSHTRTITGIRLILLADVAKSYDQGVLQILSV